MVSSTNTELMPRTICAWDRYSKSWLEMCVLISAFPVALTARLLAIAISPVGRWTGTRKGRFESAHDVCQALSRKLPWDAENLKIRYADYKGIITSAHPTSLFAIYKSKLHMQACNFIFQIHNARWINWKMSGDKLTCSVIISALEIKRIKISFVF